MGREQLGRATKQEATRKFEEPFKTKINHKELRAAKAKALAETLLKQRNIPRNVSEMLRKRPRKLKRLRSRKPVKTRKIRLHQFANENMEDVENLMFAPHLNVNFSRSRFIKGHEDNLFVFLQRNLAYQVAFDKGLSLNGKTPSKEKVRRHPQNNTETLWVHLSRFRIGKRKFFKYPFDVNVEVFILTPGNSGINNKAMADKMLKADCRKVGSFLLPYLDQSPCVKFSERRFYPKQFCEFPIQISADSSKPDPNLNSTLVLKIEAVPTNCGANLRPNVPKGLVYLDMVKKGILLLPRKNSYDMGMSFLDWSLRKISYPTVGFVGAINPAPNLGFTERCLSKRSVTRMGQFYVNPDSYWDKKNKNLDLSQLLSIEEENEDDLESYIEEKLHKMSLGKDRTGLSEASPKRETNDEMKYSNRFNLSKKPVEWQRKKKRGLSEIIPMLEKRAVLANVSKKNSNVKRLPEVYVLDSIMKSGDSHAEPEVEKLPSECLFVEPRELKKFNFCPKLGKYVVFVGDDSDEQKTDIKNSEEENYTPIDEGSRDMVPKGEDIEVDANEDCNTGKADDEKYSCSKVSKRPSVVKLTGNFAYEESNVLPIEINLVLNNGSVVKRNLNCLQCVFCVRIFDSYEILLLHLNYSHIGYNVIHFPSNYGSIIEIRVNDDGSSQSKKKEVVAQTMVEEPSQTTKKSRTNKQRGERNKMENTVDNDIKPLESATNVKSENESKENPGKSSQKTTAANSDKKVHPPGSTRSEIRYDSPLNGFIFKAHKKVKITVGESSSNNESTTETEDERKLIIELPHTSRDVLSANQLELAEKNVIGFVALNQVGVFALRKSKKRFHKVCKASLTPGGFYHSRAMTERTAVTQGYCSDNDEDVYTWYDESQQRLMDEYIDATDKEKRFMLLWNRFYRNVFPGPGDCRLPMIVDAFFATHGRLLSHEGLLLPLIVHIEMMRTFGILTQSYAVQKIVQIERLRLLEE